MSDSINLLLWKRYKDLKRRMKNIMYFCHKQIVINNND